MHYIKYLFSPWKKPVHACVTGFFYFQARVCHPFFLFMSSFPPVFLDRCHEYTRRSLQRVVDKILSGAICASLSPGATILLKPNLVSAAAPSLACTHAEFIAAVAAWFLDHSCRVRLGDSPAFGSVLHCAEQQGLLRAIRGMAVPVVDFSVSVPKRLASGRTVKIAASALECDLLVNLPKIKAHDQMLVSMAVKNIFGIVPGLRKSWLHMRGGWHGQSHRQFAEMIIELHELLPDTLVVADGIEVMHRHGPVHGDPLLFGCVAVSPSAVALDTALLAALELEPCKSPLWRVASERKIAGSSLADILFPLLQPADFFGSGFVAPSFLEPVRFQIWRYAANSLRRVVLGLHRTKE